MVQQERFGRGEAFYYSGKCIWSQCSIGAEIRQKTLFMLKRGIFIKAIVADWGKHQGNSSER